MSCLSMLRGICTKKDAICSLLFQGVELGRSTSRKLKASKFWPMRKDGLTARFVHWRNRPTFGGGLEGSTLE